MYFINLLFPTGIFTGLSIDCIRKFFFQYFSKGISRIQEFSLAHLVSLVHHNTVAKLHSLHLKYSSSSIKVRYYRGHTCSVVRLTKLLVRRYPLPLK